jgi:hypothetical protein
MWSSRWVPKMSVVCLALASQETASKYSTHAGHITDARCRCRSSLGAQTDSSVDWLSCLTQTAERVGG